MSDDYIKGVQDSLKIISKYISEELAPRTYQELRQLLEKRESDVEGREEKVERLTRKRALLIASNAVKSYCTFCHTKTMTCVDPDYIGKIEVWECTKCRLVERYVK